MELRFDRDDTRAQPEPAPRVASENKPQPDEERPLITNLADFLRRTRTLVPLATVGLFLLVLVGFVYWAKAFLMPFTMALVLSFLLRPIVALLERIHIPQIIGTILVLGAFIFGLFLLVSNTIQPAVQWAMNAPETFRQAEAKIQKLVRPAKRITQAAESVQNITGEAAGAKPVPKVEIKDNNLPITAISFARSFMTAAVETAVLLFFFLALGEMFTQKLVKILPTLHNKKQAVEITSEVQQNISRFLFTISVINACLGTLVALAAMLVGMPNAVLWGAMAALLNFVPYFGPLTGMIILAVAGFVTFDSPGHAVLLPAIYLSLHAVEANFITPMVLGRRLTMNPVVIFLALMFWMWLWGIPGALLSVPLLMMLKVLCDHFKPLAPIGEFISGNGKKTADAD